ncbi:MAG: hypothetical protein ACOYJG_07960 [Prevotella sp.]|jgi:hypothetical protein
MDDVPGSLNKGMVNQVYEGTGWGEDSWDDESSAKGFAWEDVETG